MFIVPITLISCASRGETVSGSTTSRESITVSISAACTIRRRSACCVPTRTNSVRSSSTVGSYGDTPMIASTSGSASSVCASRPPQKEEMPVTRTLIRTTPSGGGRSCR